MEISDEEYEAFKKWKGLKKEDEKVDKELGVHAEPDAEEAEPPQTEEIERDARGEEFKGTAKETLTPSVKEEVETDVQKPAATITSTPEDTGRAELERRVGQLVIKLDECMTMCESNKVKIEKLEEMLGQRITATEREITRATPEFASIFEVV